MEIKLTLKTKHQKIMINGVERRRQIKQAQSSAFFYFALFSLINWSTCSIFERYMLLVLGKSESANERTHTDQQKVKFHILGVRRKCRSISLAKANYLLEFWQVVILQNPK